MDFSIILCTFNRAGELMRTLQSLRELSLPSGTTWEVLVIDNNSTDDTTKVAAEFAQFLPVRYLVETTPGQSHAQNRGIREAKGELFLMTDDDVNVSPGWAEAFLHVARNHPEADFFGGRIIPHFQEPPPDHVSENATWLRSILHYDKGDAPFYLDAKGALFVGANIAFRRQVFDGTVWYRTDLGPIGDDRIPTSQHGGQEGELELRLLKVGRRGLYVPGSIVFHRERAYRFTRKHIRWKYRNLGREIRRREGLVPGCRCWFGVPKYLWREALQQGWNFLLTRWQRPTTPWLRAECELSRIVGEMLEWRALTGSRIVPKARAT